MTDQITLDASHNVWLQRNINSPFLGLNNTGHLDSAVGVQGLAVKEDLARDACGRVVSKRESHEPAARMRL